MTQYIVSCNELLSDADSNNNTGNILTETIL